MHIARTFAARTVLSEEAEAGDEDASPGTPELQSPPKSLGASEGRATANAGANDGANDDVAEHVELLATQLRDDALKDRQ